MGELGQRFLNKQQPGLEAQLANVADEIAYNNHDVDDGLRAGLITIEQLRELHLFSEQYDAVIQPLSRSDGTAPHSRSGAAHDQSPGHGLGGGQSREAWRRWRRPTSLAVRAHSAPLIGFSDAMREHNLELKRFLRKQLYQHYKVRRMSAKAQRVIRTLFEVFMDDPGLLPPEFFLHARTLEEVHGCDRARPRRKRLCRRHDRPLCHRGI